jgi:hypothetical protein
METVSYRILYVSGHETIGFAAQELAQYLGRILPGAEIRASRVPAFDPKQENVIWVDLPNILNLNELQASDNPFDDRIAVKTEGDRILVSGINPRSVLLAAYRFLREQGFRWIRPGKEGEVVPDGVSSLKEVNISEKPSHRHRGICVEGAFHYDNLREYIDWMPKVGFNSYFPQFFEGYTFFDRWYSHIHNPYKEPEPFDVDKAREYIGAAVEEIRKRDMIYHAVGHGWTCESIGLPGLGWDPKEYELSPEYTEYLAMVDGKRQVWNNVALNTNLCYSNPKVQTLLVGKIAGYLEENRHVGLLHFWLADAHNNQCECDNCRNVLPSDLYVNMLNELDRTLTAKQIETRIVFLIYYELLWPPVEARIMNEDRYVLMFAPITRTYSRAFMPTDETVTLPPFERNRIALSPSPDVNLAHLRAWQDIFQGDTFTYEYPMMWDHFTDGGYYTTAEVIHQDIRNLQSLGLNGYISSQCIRGFMPTGLNMAVMSQTLWNSDLSFAEIADDYFTHAFGKDGPLCRSYMEQLSHLFDTPYLRREKEKINAEQAEKFALIPQAVAEFLPTIRTNAELTANQSQRKSWEYLLHHAEIAVLFGRALEAKAQGNLPSLQEHWNNLKEYVQRNEDAVQPVFDVCLFIYTLKSKLVEEFTILD